MFHIADFYIRYVDSIIHNVEIVKNNFSTM